MTYKKLLDVLMTGYSSMASIGLVALLVVSVDVFAVPNDKQITALVGATLIDGTGGLPQDGIIVLIHGSRISAVGTAVEIPPEASVLNVTGKTIIPGLIDMHGHMNARVTVMRSQFEAYPQLFLAGGVTTVYSPGDYEPEKMVALRDRIKEGYATGPRIFTAGPYFEGHPSTSKYLESLQSVEHAIEKYTRWRDRIDSVKFYKSITEAQVRAVLELAHDDGMKATAHLGSITATRAIELGIDRLEHALHAFPELLPEPIDGPERFCKLAEVELDSPIVENLLALIVESQVVIDPTTVMLQAHSPNFEPVTPDWLKYLSSEAQEKNREPGEDEMKNNPDLVNCLDRMVEKQLQFIKKLHDLGGILVAGTDPVLAPLIPGYALHRELANFVQAGISPVEAIRIGSLNAAIALGRGSDFGSVEPGKLADLVVIDGNPAEHIEDLSQTLIVFKAGEQYAPVSLRKSAVGKIK